MLSGITPPPAFTAVPVFPNGIRLNAANMAASFATSTMISSAVGSLGKCLSICDSFRGSGMNDSASCISLAFNASAFELTSMASIPCSAAFSKNGCCSASLAATVGLISPPFVFCPVMVEALASDSLGGAASSFFRKSSSSVRTVASPVGSQPVHGFCLT